MMKQGKSKKKKEKKKKRRKVIEKDVKFKNVRAGVLSG